jgi:hypothetical protein
MVALMVLIVFAGRLMVQRTSIGVLQKAQAERRLHDPRLGLQSEAAPDESVSRSTVTSMADRTAAAIARKLKSVIEIILGDPAVKHTSGQTSLVVHTT